MSRIDEAELKFGDVLELSNHSRAMVLGPKTDRFLHGTALMWLDDKTSQTGTIVFWVIGFKEWLKIDD